MPDHLRRSDGATADDRSTIRHFLRSEKGTFRENAVRAGGEMSAPAGQVRSSLGLWPPQDGRFRVFPDLRFSGIRGRQTPGPHTIAPEEGEGLIVALRGSQCLVDQAGYFFDQSINPAKTATPIMAPKSVLSGILQESFKRYAIAFGGKQEFLKRVKPSAALPFVRGQLEIFEREPQ